jgi:hypothetical protein
MSIPTPSRRTNLLELLSELCRRRRQVTIAPARDDEGAPSLHTRFLALASNAVLLDWPVGGLANLPAAGSTVDVQFDHDGQRLGFRVTAQGRTWHNAPGRGRVEVWQLDLPVRIAPMQPRRFPRVDVAPTAPLAAECTSLTLPEHRFPVRVRNLSAGGLCATADHRVARFLQKGAIMWTQFRLPGDDRPVEFVVRVAHACEQPDRNTVSFGGMFCAGEDAGRHRAQLHRLARFLARPHLTPSPALAGPASAGA